MKTLVATPDQPRPRNEVVWTNSASTTVSGGSMRIDWNRLNVSR